MHEALAQSSDPQTALATAEQSVSIELRQSAWKRIRLGFTIDESSDSAPCADQECPVVVLSQTLDAIRLPGQRVEFWRARLPAPQPVYHSRPEIALAVL